MARRLLLGLSTLAAAALVAVGPGAASSSAAPARPAAATTGCTGVDGSPAGSGGPNRATVVVDTGSGPVWSACVSFAGSISGIEALARAEEVITDLDPQFDQYAGIGRAVCRLRGIGTDPPDCLGKSVDYWSYSHNGRVASVGAGAVTVRRRGARAAGAPSEVCIDTASSVARTESPSATMRVARASWASESSRDNSARA